MLQNISNDLVDTILYIENALFRWLTEYNTQEIASAWISVLNAVWN